MDEKTPLYQIEYRATTGTYFAYAWNDSDLAEQKLGIEQRGFEPVVHERGAFVRDSEMEELLKMTGLS